MNRVTVRQQQVLEALADYHYLVPAQMVRLGLSQSTGAMRRTLRRFEFELPGAAGDMLSNPRSAIGAIRAGVDREAGRLARMFYLTRYGAETVAEIRQTEPEQIFYPRGDRLVLADVPHRRLTIDFASNSTATPGNTATPSSSTTSISVRTARTAAPEQGSASGSSPASTSRRSWRGSTRSRSSGRTASSS